jgi:hypothetical protein
MLKPVNVKALPSSVSWVPELPTKPLGADETTGVGVAAGVAVGVAVGFAVGLEVGVAVGLAVGVAVSLAVGGGVAVVPLATLKEAFTVVVPDEVTILTVIEWVPLATFVVSHGFAAPLEVVPTKSSGADDSTCVAVPLIAVLSSQKLAFLTPVVGDRKT